MLGHFLRKACLAGVLLAIAALFWGHCLLRRASACPPPASPTQPAQVQARSTPARRTTPAKPMNILFIAVDDLRPELGCYGQSQMKTPHIDALAQSGCRFERAYCMVPTCGASRASTFSGVRPSPTRFVSYLAWAEKEAPDATTLNTHLKKHGYHTISLGKVFHHREDCLPGWSQRPWRPSGTLSYFLPENQTLHQQQQRTQPRKRGPAFEAADVADDQYPDGQLARRAIGELRRLKQRDEPFFLAVGFYKPHLPFVAPKRYWDLYPFDSVQLPPNNFVPQDAPRESIHASGELRAYHGIPAQGPVPEETGRRLIQGYYACVSFIDAQIGRVLDALRQEGLSDQTIVVLWSDHGWNLSEHTLWCKHSCYETSMKIPLIVRVPSLPGGITTRGLTESIDLYPTLCELAGIPVPEHVQGRSFVPLLLEPNQPWKPAAVGRFQQGDTIRTDRYRYTEYSTRRGQKLAEMLYDHLNDPHENTNALGSFPAEPLELLREQLQQTKGK